MTVDFIKLRFNTAEATYLECTDIMSDNKSVMSISKLGGRAQKRRGRHNNVILVHELLHILGASDKYDLATGQAIHPDGYAKSNQRLLHPQRRAAIMARAIPVDANEFNVAVRLSQTMIGDKAAREIGWSKSL